MPKKKNDDWFTSEEIPDPKEPPRPIGWRVLVRPLPISEKTSGGIILTEQVHDDMQRTQTLARVLALGPMAYTRNDMGGEPWCNVGDTVLIGKFSGLRIKYGDVKLALLNDDQVMAVIPDPSAMAF